LAQKAQAQKPRRPKVEPEAIVTLQVIGRSKPRSERITIRVGPTDTSDLKADPPMYAWNTPRLRTLVQDQAEAGDSAEVEFPDGSRWIVTVEEVIPPPKAS
jgi:hypothetical protein